MHPLRQMVGEAVDLGALRRRVEGLEQRVEALEVTPAPDAVGAPDTTTINEQGIVEPEEGALPIEAQGDLITGDAAGAATILPVGAEDGQVLTVDSAAADGIAWEAVPASEPDEPLVGAGVSQRVQAVAAGQKTFQLSPPSDATHVLLIYDEPSGGANHSQSLFFGCKYQGHESAGFEFNAGRGFSSKLMAIEAPGPGLAGVLELANSNAVAGSTLRAYFFGIAYVGAVASLTGKDQNFAPPPAVAVEMAVQAGINCILIAREVDTGQPTSSWWLYPSSYPGTPVWAVQRTVANNWGSYLLTLQLQAAAETRKFEAAWPDTADRARAQIWALNLAY